MNRQRERAIINGLLHRHGITRDVCPQYALLLEALLTEGVDEIIRSRIENGPQSGPVVAAMRRAGMRPAPSVWGAIEERAKADGITPQAAYDAAQAWLMNANRDGDASGVLDWARDGKRSNRSGRDPKPQAPVRYSPSDPADLYGGQP